MIVRKMLKRNLLKSMSVLPLFAVGIAQAQSTQPATDAKPQQTDRIKEAAKPFPIDVQGYLVSDFSVAPNQDGKSKGNLKVANSWITFSAQLNDYIRAQLTLQLDQLLRGTADGMNPGFDVGQFVEEAYIEIKLVENRPVVVIIGKQPIAFGSDFTQMPANYNSPFFEVLRQREVYGFTFKLQEVFGLDVAEFSIFETGENDMKIGSFDGGSIRLSKSLSKDVYLQGSAMFKGNGSGKDETRGDIGIVYQGEDGMTIWAEALYLKNNPIYTKGGFGLTAGGSYPVGHGRIVAEVSWLVDSFTQLAVGYKLKLTKNLAVGTEVRYTFTQGDDVGIGEGFSFGLNFEVDLEHTIDPQYNNPVFGGAEQ